MYFNHERKSVYDWNAAVAASPNPADRPASYCPECNAPLVAKRGDLVVWHWAHHRRHADGARCEYEAGETDWHLRWKAAYANTGVWLVEERYEVKHPLFGRLQLRFDACLRRDDGSMWKVREFVHSLSPSYLHKDAAILADGIELTWIFDGTEFVSERRKKTKSDYHAVPSDVDEFNDKTMVVKCDPACEMCGGTGLIHPDEDCPDSEWYYARYGHRKFLKPAALELANQLTGRVLVHFDGRLWEQWKDNVWYPKTDNRHNRMCDLFNQTETQRQRPAQAEAAA